MIQPHCGTRHFSSGISSLKQVTGREHCNLQCYILGIIIGAVPDEFIICMQALLDLHYLTQMPHVPIDALEEIEAALKTFHDHKNIILSFGYCVGKKNITINHFEIPKLELLHSVVAAIKWLGSLPQWSADHTEHSHINMIKKLKSRTNGIEYNSQICWSLDQSEKLRLFDLATAISALELDATVFEGQDWILAFETVEHTGPPRSIPNLFHHLPPSNHPSPQFLPCTFSTNTTTFHLNVKPNTSKMSLDNFSTTFSIPNLSTSINDFLAHYLHKPQTCKISGRQGHSDDRRVLFGNVKIWHSTQVQNLNSGGGLHVPQRLFAAPPSDSWSLGRDDAAIFREDVENGPQVLGCGFKGRPSGLNYYYFHALTLKSARFFHWTNMMYLPSSPLAVGDKATTLPGLHPSAQYHPAIVHAVWSKVGPRPDKWYVCFEEGKA